MTADHTGAGNPPTAGQGTGTPGEAGRSVEWPQPFIPADTPPPPDGQDERTGDTVAPYVPLLGRCLMVLAAIMAIGAAGAGAVSSFSFHQTATTTERFTVDGTPTIVLQNGVGDVRVVTGAAGQVIIQTSKEIHAPLPGGARRSLDGMAIKTAQSGDTVTIDARQGDQRPFQIGWDEISAQRTVDLLVIVPPGANLDVVQSVGSLQVEGVTGTIAHRGNVGEVGLRNVTFTGPSSIGVNTGEVEIDGALAPSASLSVTVNVGDVALALPATTDAHLDAKTDVGDITVASVWRSAVTASGGAASPETYGRYGSKDDPDGRSNRHGFKVGSTVSGDLSARPSGTLTVRVNTGDIEIGTATYSPAPPQR